MLRITRAIAIPEAAIVERFIRAPGPGGQNVNKVASAVELRFDAAGSPDLSEEVKSRLRRIAGRRMTREGILVIAAHTHRTQEANRREARRRLTGLLRQAARPPKRRKPTAPPKAARERRLRAKKLRATRKAARKPPAGEE